MTTSDFSVVDMRWGVRDEATDDHQTVGLCSREIDNCQRVSLGPNFVALLGDKYGFRPLNSKIRSSEFRALRQSLIQLDISTDFLDVWYKEDSNAIPPEYLLQPISSILKNFTNKNEPELQSIDQRIWQAIQDRLHELLLLGSGELVKQGRMALAEQQMKYSISVTEREIIEGCLDVRDAKSQCLIYIRSILDLRTQMEECLAKLSPFFGQQLSASMSPGSPNNGQDSNQLPASERRDSQTRRASLKIGDDVISLTTSAAQNANERRLERQRKLIGRYIDMCCKANVWTLDEEAQAALTTLKEVKLGAKLKDDGRNLTKFKIFWHEQDGISLKSDDHKRYLNELTEHFYSHLTRMIRKASKHGQKFKSGPINEVLQHSHYAQHVSKSFHGRNRELDMIRDYVLGDALTSSRPMFVYGVSGSGKTSLLARVATLSKEWIIRAKTIGTSRVDEIKWNQRPCILMRFCGTTPSSSSMVDVLTSVCRQLQFNFYQYGPLNGALDNQQEAALANSDGDARDAQLAYQKIPDDFVQLVFTFRQLLDNCRHKHHEQRLFLIILDSIERLGSPAQSSVEVKYSWLTSIVRLPPNVRLLVSCGSEENSIGSEYQSFLYLKRHFLQSYFSNIQMLRTHLNREQPAWIVHVKPMGVKLAQEVVRIWLREANRTLSGQQWALVEKCFNHCSRPIFVKLAFGEVLNWRSYSMQSDAKSLTFGASLLKDKSGQLMEQGLRDELISNLIKADPGAVDSADETDELKWQILNMEQEWLNYLDYKQRKQQIMTTTTTESTTELFQSDNRDPFKQTKQDDNQSGSVMIKIDAMLSSSGSSKPSNSASASAMLCHLSNTIDDAINQLFARIELQHGFILTKHSLSYITAARNGICENELEDILSLDDIVLDDVFQYHLPPVRRIPPLLWTRIRNDLPDYLSEREADGIVINWHHSQFRKVTESRYLSDPQHVTYIHSILADYFLGRWADKPKPFRCTRQQIQMAAEQLDSAVQQSIRESQTVSGGSVAAGAGASFNQPRNSLTGSFDQLNTAKRSGSLRSCSFVARGRLRGSDTNDQRLQLMQAKADRRVPNQPIYYLISGQSSSTESMHQSEVLNSAETLKQSGQGIDLMMNTASQRRYNMRKLTELPYHLIRAGRYHDLSQGVLFNYQWLFASLEALSLQNLLLDFEDSIREIERAIQVLRQNAKRASMVEPSSSNERIIIELRSMGQLGGENDHAPDDLEQIVNQLKILYNTIRLSCSTLHSDPQMLAPQLIGRLMSVVNQARSLKLAPGEKSSVKWLDQLLSQCDNHGCSDCSLLPIDHNLESPNGMQLSSLEGHSFAITSMSIAADQRHLLAVSNRFIMWDISTGQISRDVDPKIDGSIMCQLEMGYNNEFAIAFTSDNLILVFDILTQQVSKFEGFVDKSQTSSDQINRRPSSIRGIGLIDKYGATRFVVWTNSSYSILKIVNDELTGTITMKMRISVELVYEIDMDKLIEFEFVKIISVQISRLTTQKYQELNLIQLEVSENLVRLVTIVASVEDGLWTHKVWRSGDLCGQSLSLDLSLKQAVFCDTSGSVYLSRRRSLCWSNPKLLYDPSRVGVAIESDDFVPFAIETISIKKNTIDLASSEHDLDLCALAEFERKVDNLTNEDEIETNYIFDSTNVKGSNVSNSIGQTQAQEAAKLVQLCYGSKMVVLMLDSKLVKVLRFPKGIQNISIDINRSQMKTVTLGREYLILAVGKKLLFYSIIKEQLLKCIEDAHSARIVHLLPIWRSDTNCSTISLNERRPSADQLALDMKFGGNLSVASASLDKTVKIWTLSNLDKEDLLIDRLEDGIESICLAPQLPLAACLARGQMGLFNWTTMRLVHPKLGYKGSLEANQKAKIDSKILMCKFSFNGQMVSIAGSKWINLYTIEPSVNVAKLTYANSNIDRVELRLLHKFDLSREGSVQELKFVQQDARLIAVIELSSDEDASDDEIEPKSPSIQENTYEDVEFSQASDSNDDQSPNRPEVKQRDVLVLCFSITTKAVVFARQCKTPLMGKSVSATSKTNYLSSFNTTNEKQPETKVLLKSLRNHKETLEICVPVITLDNQHFVIVEVNDSKLTDQRTDILSMQKPDSFCLNVYSTRDGLLVRTVDLSHLECTNYMLQSNDNEVKRGQSKISSEILAYKGLDIKKTAARSASTNERPFISLTNEHFSSMKPTIYRDRQSIVALMHRDSGQSYLIDVSTRQLLASSDIWAGKVTSDGRFGLSRFFRSNLTTSGSISGAKRPSLMLASQTNGNSSFGTTNAPVSSSIGHRGAGLELLEMHRMVSIRPLLNDRDLSKLSGSEFVTARSETHLDCDFTRPNDDYVYYHDSKLARLLLIRLRDSKLVANYKLPVPIRTIEISPDGLALIAGLSDGSLCSLAIVDRENSDTLTRLSQYPSRNRN